MVVSAVSASQVESAVEGAIGGEAATIKAVDISFRCDGKEIEPKKAVSVKLAASGMDAEADKHVVHIDDGGNASVVSGASVTDSGVATFSAKDFSIYLVVDTDIPEDQEQDAVATYEFYLNGEKIDNFTQNIKSGDTLQDPGVPSGVDGANTVFKGWYVGKDKLSFGKKESVPETETIKVEAKVETTYYVTFYGEKDSEGKPGIVAVKTVTVDGPKGTEGSLDISDVTVTPKADTSAFEGWSETDGGAVLAENTITVTENKELYASVVNAHWIHFDENVDWDISDSDPTYTGPVYVKNTDDLSTKKPENPTREGYTFGGWYEDEGCKTAFSWTGIGLTEDITLYAKWNPGDAAYKVIIWKQKVTDAKDAEDSAKTYDFEASIDLTGTTGEAINVADFSEYTGYNYTGFHYSGRIEASPSTIRADGTTVVNVYYDRNLLTINFVKGSHYEYTEATDNNGTQYGLINGEYVQLTRSGRNGNYTWSYTESGTYSGTYYHQVYNYSGTQYGVVNGQLVQLTLRNYTWYDNNGNRYNGDRYATGTTGWGTTYGIVDGELTALYYDWQKSEYTYSKTITYSGNRYKLSDVPTTETYTGLYGSSLEANGYEWPSDDTWYQNPNSGGTRLTFLDAFKFEGLSGVSSDGKVLTQYAGSAAGNNPVRFYKQNLNGSYPTTATNTVYTGNNSSFTVTEKYEGFTAVQYRNSNTSNWTSISAGQSANAANLQLRFKRNTYTLTFMSDGKSVGTVENIPYEGELSSYKNNIDDPEKAHYNFLGWYEDPTGQTPVDWSSTMPAANKVVYAKWEAKQYHVSLDANGGELVGTQDAEFNVPLDTVLSKDSLFQNVVYDTKHELVGWFYKSGDNAGSVYDYGKIEEDVSLIAKWRIPGQVSIKYDGGGHGSGPPTDDFKYATDSTVVLGAPPTTIDDGYTFVGWKLKKGDGTVYYVSNTFDITEDLIENYSESTKTGEITVIAVYNENGMGSFATTTITYNANGGTGSDVTVDGLKVNEPITAKTVTDAGFAREGYEFVNWNTDPNGKGLEVEGGAKIAADKLKIDDGNTEANTLYAQWKQIEYTVKYVDGVADEDIFKDEVHKGLKAGENTPAFNNGTDPTREGYAFDGWEPEVSEKIDVAKADKDHVITYTAKWTQTFTVTWKTQDGKDTLETDLKVANGTQPSYDSAAPTKDADAQYTYTFAGWATSENQETGTTVDKLPAVTADVTYYAAFSKTVNKYTVTFVDEDGTVLKEATEYEYGTAADKIAKPADPTKAPTAEYTYTFAGWTPAITDVTGNATYTATYAETKNSYTVTYTDGVNGAAFENQSSTAEYGSATPEFEGTPTRDGYTFEGWSPEVAETVTGDAEYTAQWTAVEPDPEPTPTPDPTPTPTPAGPTDDDDDDDDTPTPAGGGGGGAAAVVPAAAAGTPAATTIADDPTPQAEPETIIDDPTPQAAPEGTWALLNLLAAALSTIGAAVAIFRKKEDEDDDPDSPDNDDEEDNRGRKMTTAKVLGAAAAAASIVAFILTEDMSQQMAMVDNWTVLMAALFAGQIGTAVANKKASETAEDEDDAE